MLGVCRLQVGQYASHPGRISSATMYSTFLVPEATNGDKRCSPQVATSRVKKKNPNFVELDMAMLAVAVFGTLSCSSESFVNTDVHTKYAAFSVVASLNGTLKRDIGKVSN